MEASRVTSLLQLIISEQKTEESKKKKKQNDNRSIISFCAFDLYMILLPSFQSINRSVSLHFNQRLFKYLYNDPISSTLSKSPDLSILLYLSL